jgi:hypothetical protein
MRFGVYYVGKQQMGLGTDGKIDSRTNFAFSCLSGTIAGFLANPFFLLKTQFQVRTGKLLKTVAKV